jgi:hypothetical protein
MKKLVHQATSQRFDGGYLLRGEPTEASLHPPQFRLADFFGLPL